MIRRTVKRLARVLKSRGRLAVADIVTGVALYSYPPVAYSIHALHRDSDIHETNHNAATG